MATARVVFKTLTLAVPWALAVKFRVTTSETEVTGEVGEAPRIIEAWPVVLLMLAACKTTPRLDDGVRLFKLSFALSKERYSSIAVTLFALGLILSFVEKLALTCACGDWGSKYKELLGLANKTNGAKIKNNLPCP